MGKPPDSDDGSGRARQRHLLRYAGLGTELAASVIGLTLLGLWVDYRYETGPVGVLVGAGLGIVGGLYNLIRAALRFNISSDRGPRRGSTAKRDDNGTRT